MINFLKDLFTLNKLSSEPKDYFMCKCGWLGRINWAHKCEPGPDVAVSKALTFAEYYDEIKRRKNCNCIKK